MRDYSWNNNVSLWHHLFVLCGPAFERVLCLPEIESPTPMRLEKPKSISKAKVDVNTASAVSKMKRKAVESIGQAPSPGNDTDTQDIKRRKLDLFAKQLELAKTKIAFEHNIIENYNKLLPGYTDGQMLQGLLIKKQKELATCYVEIKEAEKRDEEVFLLQSLDRSKLRLQKDILMLEAKLDALANQ